jgi:hypothetical protein
LWCSSCSCFLMVQLLQAMMILLILFHSSLIVISSWYIYIYLFIYFYYFYYFYIFFHDALLFHFFSTMLLSSCFLAYQSHSNYDPLPFPPTSCLFSCEFGECKHARTCPFAWCLAIATFLATHCAFVVNPKFTPRYPNGCEHKPIWNFL